MPFEVAEEMEKVVQIKVVGVGGGGGNAVNRMVDAGAKSTTYTVLRRLCERGLFRNEGGTVTSVIGREEFYAMQSERFVEETFSGSLPGFLAAFTRRRSLSRAEIDEIRRMIDTFEEV